MRKCKYVNEHDEEVCLDKATKMAKVADDELPICNAHLLVISHDGYRDFDSSEYWEDDYEECDSWLRATMAQRPRGGPGNLADNPLVGALGAWAATQVQKKTYISWRHALAGFLVDANIGLEFCPQVEEFLRDPEKMRMYLRGEHL